MVRYVISAIVCAYLAVAVLRLVVYCRHRLPKVRKSILDDAWGR